MRRLLLLSLAACGNPTHPAPPHLIPDGATAVVAAPDARPSSSDLGIDWATVPHEGDEQALAIWDRLGLDGDNWEERLSDIPDDADDVREAMARALLRQGNFACTPVVIPAACGQTDREYPKLTAADHLDNPCLRRLIALWAIDEIPGDELESDLAADAIAIAGLPPPEDDLNRAVLAKTDDTTVRMQMLDAAERAGNEQVADDNLGNLSQHDIEIAALTLHIDGALEALDPEESRQVYAQAIAQPGLHRETRVKAAQALADAAGQHDPGDPIRDELIAALAKGAKADDCAVAAAAASGLATAQNKAFPPAPPKNAKEADLMRAMCVDMLGANDVSPLWRAIVGAKGVVVRRLTSDPGRVAKLWADNPDAEDVNKDGVPDVPEADADGDGDPRTWAEVIRVPREDMVDLPDRDELLRALPECQGVDCKVPDEDVTFHFLFRKSAGRLQLDTIERRETVHDCGPQ